MSNPVAGSGACSVKPVGRWLGSGNTGMSESGKSIPQGRSICWLIAPALNLNCAKPVSVVKAPTPTATGPPATAKGLQTPFITGRGVAPLMATVARTLSPAAVAAALQEPLLNSEKFQTPGWVA